jgi:CRISPR-associated protein Csb1
MTNTKLVLDPTKLAADDGPLRLVLTARLRPVAGLGRFQPAGFPEIGHVIYDAPRGNASSEKVCIVDSAASMANHLEWVCMRGRWDLDLAKELNGVPYLRCVTDRGWPKHVKNAPSDDDHKKVKELEDKLKKTREKADGASGDDNGELQKLEKDLSEAKQALEKLQKKSQQIDQKDLEVVVTSLTEGHRIASTYFLGGRRIESKKLGEDAFEAKLAAECGILPLGKKKAHPSPEAWWKVFSTIFKYDPNALVHGVLFPQWQVKIPRVLTAHLEALGAGRVDSSGVKFDRLGKTTSGQPIFSKDEGTAREIRATFILDLALLRSFGRGKQGENGQKGLHDKQKAFLVAFALWKIGRLVHGPFKYRTGCDLECEKVVEGLDDTKEDDLKEELTNLSLTTFTKAADFPQNPITDIYWPADELYRAGKDDAESPGENEEESEEEEAEPEDEE